MIHEYRTYTLALGQLQAYFAAGENRGVHIRGDRYGRLVGFWVSEFGTLNQVHHIWEYPSLDARQAARAALAANRDWNEQFLQVAWPTMQEQLVRFMLPRAELSPPTLPSRFYESRIYRCPAGRFEEAVEAVRARPRNGHLFGLWLSETPQPNEVVEITAYADFDARLRDALRTPPQQDWQTAHTGLFQQIESTLLLPVPLSPVQ